MIKYLKRGVTLIELLVTLAVVSLLAAIVLPGVKVLLADRRSSQAAIVVKNYLEAARARAVSTGRPVAVVLERISSRPADINQNGMIDSNEIGISGTSSVVTSNLDPFINYIPYNTCVRLSLAEAPSATSSDSLGLPSSIHLQSQNNGPQPTINPIRATEIGPFYRVDIFLQEYSPTGTVIDLACAPRIRSSIRAGDEISFESASRFMIVELTTAVDGTGLEVMSLFFLNNNVVLNPTEIAINNLKPAVSDNFRIYPKPRPIATQSAVLPKGMCIDLSISGFADNKIVYTYDPNTQNVIADPLAAARDYRLRLSSAWVAPISVNPLGALAPIPQAFELRPIYIVFRPDGTFSRLYSNWQRQTTDTNYNSSFKPIDAAEDLYLHVGKIDQVRVNPLIPPYAGNLADTSSYIVRVSAKSGSVSAAPTGTIRTAEDTQLRLLFPNSGLGDFVELARKRSFGQLSTGQ